ncbi:MAG: DNA repair protein RadC [Alphaproteobacteria bacterium]|nr:DNA repair protein RadC [Alphaproteobacteria bacterium]
MSNLHYVGHRARLRRRFLETDGTGMPDYEVLELLFFNAMPRRDVKPLVKSLLETFGSLNAISSASVDDLRAFGLKDATIVLLRVSRELSRRRMKEGIINKPILKHWEGIVDYCRAVIAHEGKERFLVLFLNRNGLLLGEEVLKYGTIDQITVFPREIIQSALNKNASSIVLVHNHPSGDLEPSRVDIEMTRQILQACAAVKIHVHDHLIVSCRGFMSFKISGLL